MVDVYLRMGSVETPAALLALVRSRWRLGYREVLSDAVQGKRESLLFLAHLLTAAYAGIRLAGCATLPATAMPMLGWSVPPIVYIVTGLSTRAWEVVGGRSSRLLLAVPWWSAADFVGIVFFLGFDIHIWLTGGWFLSRLLGLYLLFYPTLVTLIATSFKLADAGAHPVGVAHARWLPQLASSYVAGLALAAAWMAATPSLYLAAAVHGSRELSLRLGLLGNVVRLRINSSKHGFMVMPELVVNAQVRS